MIYSFESSSFDRARHGDRDSGYASDKIVDDSISSSLGFRVPKPAWPHPETRLAGYKRKRAIDQTFPSNVLVVATMLLRPMAPPRRRGGAT